MAREIFQLQELPEKPYLQELLILQPRQSFPESRCALRTRQSFRRIIGNTDISEEKKQEAINTMVSMTELAEKEAAAELLLEAKGFENVVVNLTGETADIVVPDSALEDAQRAQIEDIVKRKTGIAAENIVSHL